jgi:acetate kinase
MDPAILVINSGSSSLKFSLIDIASHLVLISGIAEKLGLPDGYLTVKYSSKETFPLSPPNHVGAMENIVTILQHYQLSDRILAVGHRVVHGGEQFKSSTLIDHSVLLEIERCIPFAPLHNPAHLEGIRAAMKFAPNIPHVAVFDTAFHQTLSPTAFLYALPKYLYVEHGVRRYGFHGTSHRYVSMEAARFLGLDIQDSAFITAHLGNGASAAAILNGKSVDTTMGFTPLEGLVMGTRSGDIDPALVTYIAERLGISANEVVNLLNKKSGLLGISELSSDVRDLQDAAANGHEGAQLALDIFVHRLAKYIAALTVSLPRVDALVFTGGIGENAALIREKTIRKLAVLGYALDVEANQRFTGGNQGIITTPNSTKAMVINTNEELMIALDTAKFL